MPEGTESHQVDIDPDTLHNDAHGHGGARARDKTSAGVMEANSQEPGKRVLGPAFWIAVGWIAIIALAAIFANLLPLPNPNLTGAGPAMAGPSLAHLLGTDELGRDLLSRLIFGTRVSLVVSFASIAIGTAIGGSLGIVAGYVGGVVDWMANALAYIILAFPPLLLLLAIAAFSKQTLPKLVAEFAFLSLAPLFRVTRGATLAVANREFVQAAVASGAGRFRILTREILPSVLPSVISYALLGVAIVIVGEGSLAFLGLSVALPTPSWGNMIAEGRTFLAVDPWISLIPSLAMFSLLLALNFSADKLGERFGSREAKL
ncbi:MAG: ABC transporter permease [Actinobacteria bacterium]|jgi:peptide/nickel transport system permease protein|nr:ABC transporter permease [Actinomycetota bacterium]MCL5444517.1 ABC transporter permease [Actinomycetota bacterium]